MKNDFNISDLERVFLNKPVGSGTLIAIVGFDGAGKTTQIDAIASKFANCNKEVLVTKQPTEWYRNLPIQHHFSGHNSDITEARVLALMSAADRHKHVNEVILPALSNGKVVICDRYVYTAFGVFIRKGLPSSFISEINKGIPKPDYAFYLRASPEILMERLTNRDDGNLKYGERKASRIAAVTQTYEKMCPSLIAIDGNQPINKVTSDIMKHIRGAEALGI